MTSEMAAGAEKPGDRDSLLGVLALGALVFRCSEEQGAFDKKLLRQLLDLHQQVCWPSIRQTYCGNEMMSL